jgi:SagB-type dehydrogenase family enzyme
VRGQPPLGRSRYTMPLRLGRIIIGSSSSGKGLGKRMEVAVMSEGIGDSYHRETKYYPDKMSGRGLDWAGKPSPYKEYPGSRRIELPQPAPGVKMDLDQILRKRSSVRDYAGEPLSIEDLSYLLWACTGIQRAEQGYQFRTAPSAGALYPIETYVVANNVRDLEQGLYHYAIRAHSLEDLRLDDLRLETAQAALGQRVCYDAAAVFVWTAIFQRSKWKYEQRGYRYIYMDAGHIAENLYLAATGLELGVCAVGALFDDELNHLLDVDGVAESAFYMATIGHPARF